MKSIKQIEQDPRVYMVERNDDWDRDNPEDAAKYFLWLEDGYTFDGYSGMEAASSVKDLNDLLNEIKEAAQ